MLQARNQPNFFVVVVVRKGIHSGLNSNITGAEGLFFLYLRLLYRSDQILAVMMLSQHQVSSIKIVRPRAPCGARRMGHAIKTWSAVCSRVPHSQFGDRARPHFCMNEGNRPKPVRRQLNLTEAVRGKVIPTSLALVIV